MTSGLRISGGAQLTTTLGATLGATQQCSVPVAVKARAATHTR